MQSVLMSGSSGLLGRAIGAALRTKSIGILSLVRHASERPDEIKWQPEAGHISKPETLEGIDAAIHLSGASLAGHRWSKEYKRELVESRVTSTRVLAEALARLKRRPSVLITASAVGFYGDRGDEIVDEESPAGRGFLAELCQAWEQAAQPAQDAGIRVAHLRFGVVLSRSGGALGQMLPLFKAGLGGRLGNGRQWMSWVSEADVIGAMLFVLNAEGRGADLSGPVNVVAPQAVTNSEFTRQLGRALHRPTLLPAPAFALRLAFGEMANAALLASTHVVPCQLINAGYTFRHPLLSDGLHEALLV
jgi:uncharacterized protein (TIGR01777 family)